jgi:3-deoxy-D-manno-octulosonic-acid transferase
MLAKPIVCLYIKKRIANGLEMKERVRERFGAPSQERPEGKLVWFHAVSVGETNSVIPFIKEFKKINPDINVLLTTTTITAASIVEQRLKDAVIHQFVPFDIFMWVRRFIKYWRPKAFFLVESEIWFNTLYYLYEKNIPIYLLNARFSDKTIKRMSIAKKYFKILPFKLFTEIFVPSSEMKKIVQDLGSKDTTIIPNMKIISPKLPINKKEEKKLKEMFSKRKTWMAVSSHKNEEEIILKTHKEAKNSIPSLLTVIAIRHPNRAEEVKILCENKGLSVTLHTNEHHNSELTSEIYILNKIGHLGEFFSTIDTVLVCGSLIPGIGGHNFIEPINFLCNTATGQYIDNFRDVYPYFERLCQKLANEDDITKFVIDSINHYKRPVVLKTEFNYTDKWLNVIKRISKAINA